MNSTAASQVQRPRNSHEQSSEATTFGPARSALAMKSVACFGTAPESRCPAPPWPADVKGDMAPNALLLLMITCNFGRPLTCCTSAGAAVSFAGGGGASEVLFFLGAGCCAVRFLGSFEAAAAGAVAFT